ncbi:MAG: (2Fe-2S)-binding protein [Rhodanobacter sp.]
MRAMYICMCHAVTDHDIRREAAAGVQTFDELQERTGCGDCCGCCQDEARATFVQAKGQVICQLPLIAA